METDECLIMAPDKTLEPLPASVTCRILNTPRQSGTEESLEVNSDLHNRCFSSTSGVEH